MTAKIYDFLAIPEIPREANDAYQQIADSLRQLEGDSNVQVGAGWDGMGTTVDRTYNLTTTAQQIIWDESMSNRFGSVLADPGANDAMILGTGVFAQTLGGLIEIVSPTGAVRDVIITLVDLVNSNIRGQTTIKVEKQVEEITFSGTFLSQIETLNAWAMFIEGNVSFDVILKGWTWYAWDISPLGYAPPNVISGASVQLAIQGNTQQIPLGFFGGIARDINSGIGPLQAVTAPVPVGGFDIIKPARSIVSPVLATASITIDSDGLWDVRFALSALIQLNARYLFFVWLNGARTECGAVSDPSNQTDEISVSSTNIFNLTTGDVLQLQIESPTGPSNFEMEFGSFTAFKVGEAP